MCATRLFPISAAAKRDKAAALKFLKRVMKKYGRPLSDRQPTGFPPGHAAVSKHEDAAKIQLSSCPGPQPFQSGAPSRHPPGLQTKALRRLGRVARPRGLIAAWVCACCAQRRRPAVALTKPLAIVFFVAGNYAGALLTHSGLRRSRPALLGADEASFGCAP